MTPCFKRFQSAINLVAACARVHWSRSLFVSVLGVLVMAGCSVLPDKPMRASMYDFGPGVLASPAAARPAPLAPLTLDDVSTSGGALENMAVLYRLAYTDVQQLRPYALARWSMPPAQLVEQRLREQLGQRRAVFHAGDGVSLNRSQNTALPLPLLLRLELQEFSHLFTAPEASVGLIRLRATLLDISSGAELLVGQRSIVVQRPATTGDAPGGVRALTAATDAAIEELEQWLQQSAAR